MQNEDWKLQVSIKTPTGDLINVRAITSDELSVLLEGIADFSHQIAATSKAVSGAYTLTPLATSISTADVMQPPLSIPDQAKAQSPTCIHGPRVFRSGVSKKNGQPYAFWSCPQPQGADQCKPVN